MKLICINNSSLEIGTTAPITPGKIYESIESFSSKESKNNSLNSINEPIEPIIARPAFSFINIIKN